MAAFSFWSLPIDELVGRVNSSANGLSQDAAREILRRTGPNRIQVKKRVTLLLLFFDPPKEGVRATIESLEKMGVTLKIITGDNHLVAQHIGQVVGPGDFKFIRRFMLVFGSLSSFFDLTTFGVLLWLMKAGEDAFHTGWFIDSVLSAGIVALHFMSAELAKRWFYKHFGNEF